MCVILCFLRYDREECSGRYWRLFPVPRYVLSKSSKHSSCSHLNYILWMLSHSPFVLAESLRRETTEGQWIKKRKTSPTRRHKRNRSLKNNEAMEPTNEASIGALNQLFLLIPYIYL